MWIAASTPCFSSVLPPLGALAPGRGPVLTQCCGLLNHPPFLPRLFCLFVQLAGRGRPAACAPRAAAHALHKGQCAGVPRGALSARSVPLLQHVQRASVLGEWLRALPSAGVLLLATISSTSRSLVCMCHCVLQLVKAALVAVWKFEVEKEHAVAVVTAQRRQLAQVCACTALLSSPACAVLCLR